MEEDEEQTIFYFLFSPETCPKFYRQIQSKLLLSPKPTRGPRWLVLGLSNTNRARGRERENKETPCRLMITFANNLFRSLSLIALGSGQNCVKNTNSVELNK